MVLKILLHFRRGGGGGEVGRLRARPRQLTAAVDLRRECVVRACVRAKDPPVCRRRFLGVRSLDDPPKRPMILATFVVPF